MAKGKKITPGQRTIFFWKLAAVLLAAIGVGLGVLLWVSGEKETKDAYEKGRRLLIRIDNGVIEGNPVTIGMTAKPVPPQPEAPTPTPTPTPIPAPTPVPTPLSSPSGEAPASNGLPPETMTAPPAPLPLDQITPSATPIVEQNPKLVEKTTAGMLPVIGTDGIKPWRYYSKSFERTGGKPMIAVIVSGLGHNKTVANRALQLPENITLSFSPYARDIASWGQASRISGHENLIDLPLQPSNYPVTDPGPYGLLIELGTPENETRLQWSMSRLPVYIGFLTPQNEGFSSNDEAFKLLLQSLANRGLMMVVGREPAKNDTKEIIDHTNTAIVVADVLIDEDLSEAAIQTRLSTLEQLAQKRGYAVGVAQAFPITLEQLRQWSESLAAKGIVLVPISAVARLRFS